MQKGKRQNTRKWDTIKSDWFHNRSDPNCELEGIVPLCFKTHIAMDRTYCKNVANTQRIIENICEEAHYQTMLFNFKIVRSDNLDLPKGAEIVIYPKVRKNENNEYYRTLQFIAFIHDVCQRTDEKCPPRLIKLKTYRYIKGSRGRASYRMGNTHNNNGKAPSIHVYDFAGNFVKACDYISSKELIRNKKMDQEYCMYNPERLPDIIQLVLENHNNQAEKPSLLQPPLMGQPGIFPPAYKGLEYFENIRKKMANEDPSSLEEIIDNDCCGLKTVYCSIC